jgi:hypothetical protein
VALLSESLDFDVAGIAVEVEAEVNPHSICSRFDLYLIKEKIRGGEEGGREN